VTARFKAGRTLSYRASALSDCVQNVKLFQDCSEDFRMMIQENVTVKIFPAGMEIFRQGQYGEEMYMLTNGSVEVSSNSVCVATLEAGSIFGEMAVLTKNLACAKRTATIHAKTNCVCRIIYRDDLNSILRRFPKDKAVLEAEANRRREGLKNIGILPKKVEWWRPVPQRQDQEGEVKGAQHLWRNARRLSLGAVQEQRAADRFPRRSSDASVYGRGEWQRLDGEEKDVEAVESLADVSTSDGSPASTSSEDRTAQGPSWSRQISSSSEASAAPSLPHCQEDTVLPPIHPASRKILPTHMLEAALSGAEVSQTDSRDTSVATVGKPSRALNLNFARFRRRSL
jgi:hypothetical protein